MLNVSKIKNNIFFSEKRFFTISQYIVLNLRYLPRSFWITTNCLCVVCTILLGYLNVFKSHVDGACLLVKTIIGVTVLASPIEHLPLVHSPIPSIVRHRMHSRWGSSGYTSLTKYISHILNSRVPKLHKKMADNFFPGFILLI